MGIFSKTALTKAAKENIKYLDGISEGLISYIKPKKLEFIDGKIKGDNFQLIYSKNTDNSNIVVLTGKYSSPIGPVYMGFTIMRVRNKEKFEKIFLKKSKLDSFFSRLNNENSGLIKKMITDQSNKPTVNKHSVSFVGQIMGDGKHYAFDIESNKGLFFYNKFDLDGQGEFMHFEKEIKLNDSRIIFNDLIGAKLAYNEIIQEEAQKVAQKGLNKLPNSLRYLPSNFKLINAKFDEELVGLLKKDSFGIFSFEKEKFDGKEKFSYEINGDYSDWSDQINAWGCYSHVDKGKTTLVGNPLLIVSLGRELASGKLNLLKKLK